MRGLSMFVLAASLIGIAAPMPAAQVSHKTTTLDEDKKAILGQWELAPGKNPAGIWVRLTFFSKKQILETKQGNLSKEIDVPFRLEESGKDRFIVGGLNLPDAPTSKVPYTLNGETLTLLLTDVHKEKLLLTRVAKLPAPLPKEVVAAWDKATSRAGWMGRPDDGSLTTFREGGEGLPGEVPAFQFAIFPAFVKIDKLPQPKVPFGLSFNFELTAEEMDQFAKFKQVQVLSFNRNRVSDDVLKALVGLESLQTLDLYYAVTITDQGLKELARLKSLKRLDLGFTKVTDAGLKELTALKELQYLGLYGTAVTDAGLKNLARLKLKRLVLGATVQTNLGLKHYLAAIETPAYLNLDGWHVTDAGLKELAALKNLDSLNLSHTKITGVGFKDLTGLKVLHKLNLGAAPLSDAGLKEVARLESLQALYLNYTKITDAGLNSLAGLQNLRFLDLDHTNVSDKGLKELATLKNLQELRLGYTKATPVGIAELQKALPKLK